MRWHRRPHSYESRTAAGSSSSAARMSHGTNAWLIWRLGEDDDGIESDSVGVPYAPGSAPVDPRGGP